MAGRLRTVAAVLAAASRAAVDDRAEVDVLAAEMTLEPAGAFLQFLERCSEEEGEIVRAADAVAGDDIRCQLGRSTVVSIHFDGLALLTSL